MNEEYPSDFLSQVQHLPGWLRTRWGCSGGVFLVFGTGPSLEEMSDEFWARAKEHMSCGVNGFPLLKPVVKQHFIPDLLLGIDPIRVQDMKENYPGIRKYWESKTPGIKPLRLMAVANCDSTETDLYYGNTADYREQKNGFCKYGRSSVQAAVHWGALMFKPKTIALFGVDYKGPGRAGGLQGNTSHQHGPKLEATFGEMNSGISSYGIELINCSPGTGLKAIPAKSWREVI